MQVIKLSEEQPEKCLAKEDFKVCFARDKVVQIGIPDDTPEDQKKKIIEKAKKFRLSCESCKPEEDPAWRYLALSLLLDIF